MGQYAAAPRVLHRQHHQVVRWLGPEKKAKGIRAQRKPRRLAWRNQSRVCNRLIVWAADNSPAGNYRKAVRLTAQVGSLVATMGRVASGDDPLQGYYSTISAAELLVRPMRTHAAEVTHMQAFLTGYPHLHVLPADPHAMALGEERLVETDQTIRFGSVRYSTPDGHQGTKVWVRVVGEELVHAVEVALLRGMVETGGASKMVVVGLPNHGLLAASPLPLEAMTELFNPQRPTLEFGEIPML